MASRVNWSAISKACSSVVMSGLRALTCSRRRSKSSQAFCRPNTEPNRFLASLAEMVLGIVWLLFRPRGKLDISVDFGQRQLGPDGRQANAVGRVVGLG